MKDRFYLACFRNNVGTSVGFQRQGFAGYHTDIDQAHVCTLEEAQSHYNHAREYDLPISADHVDALAVWKVDCQYIPIESQPFTEANVAYVRGAWDGNDVYWLNHKKCTTSTDFSKATIFDQDIAEQLDSKYIVIPFSLAEKVKRRTFNFKKLNRRVMVQGAGLVMPEYLKKARRRKTNPKSRFNCPGCGKITWQYNPYDFEGCLDVSCSEWRPNYGE
ncbi:hypothetical protein [Acinetobacter indicus]|uniref:hypothetical protein n=1 Tax=Acinetobacter indicus TaxID=756892 RepID=UPI00209BB26B|nr:hypothetical protein [Acinetobacter indicus]MCO8088211.1 hypothetical protein [Acinetobacter indicus]